MNNHLQNLQFHSVIKFQVNHTFKIFLLKVHLLEIINHNSNLYAQAFNDHNMSFKPKI
jgi:hypothetical protein